MTPREQLIEAIAGVIDRTEADRDEVGWPSIERAGFILEAIEAENYVLIKSKDENGNPLIVASAEAVQQISAIAIEEFREVVRQEMRSQR
jgi:hypothetical protein